MNWHEDSVTKVWEAEDEELEGATWSIEPPEEPRYNMVTLWLIIGGMLGETLHEQRVGQFISVKAAKDWIEKTGRAKYKKMWEEA
jgi:hypothetical protein